MAPKLDPTIAPDEKDWTWVLDRVCGECGFDVRSFDREEVGDLVRANVVEWADLLDGPGPGVRARPRPDTWSILEYACHVRDVLRIYDGRLQRMLTEDAPRYANWDQDATAVELRYAEQSPAVVAAQLAVAGEQIASRFDGVRDHEWERTGHRSDGAEFTVETFARYFIHDPVHHLHDVRVPEGPAAPGGEGA